MCVVSLSHPPRKRIRVMSSVWTRAALAGHRRAQREDADLAASVHGASVVRAIVIASVVLRVVGVVARWRVCTRARPGGSSRPDRDGPTGLRASGRAGFGRRGIGSTTSMMRWHRRALCLEE
mmetsp:Transcript_2832/g.10778  ORF Transcript_2832/g.10778 Transcript_2832/m.10778 type:complete len:122 (-) Transcript_2832:134-499(-)